MNMGEERISKRVRRGKSSDGQVSAKVSSMQFLLCLKSQGELVADHAPRSAKRVLNLDFSSTHFPPMQRGACHRMP